LDPNLEIDGVKLFQSRLKANNKLWEGFVEKQLSLIPDETEPYVYPDIDRLRTEISS